MKLTLPQQDIYFEQLLYPKDPVYNIGANIIIKGNISYDMLNDAYIALINQHDAYRCIVVGTHQDVTIETLTGHNTSLDYKDFSKEESPKEKANEFMRNTFQNVFRFEDKTLLHKFILIKVEDSIHYLFSMYHHIITDGWGTSLMFQRLVKNYNELANHGRIITEYPYSYEDFVSDDALYHASQDFQNDKQYWKEKFKNLNDRFLHKINTSIKANKSSRKELFINRSVYNQLEQLAKETKSSTFHIILGIIYLYFGRKHQINEFAVGLPVLNRSKSVFKKTVGLFMGVSALQIQLDYEKTFVDLIQQIKQKLRKDYRHQRFPLGKLIQELELFEDKDRLFNITLSYEKQNYADHFKNTKTTVVPLTHESERVALAMYIREFDITEDVKIDFDYNLNYFEAESIQKVVDHFEFLIHQISVNPDQQLLGYKCITPEEEKHLLINFNQTKFEYPKKTVCTLFKEQVQKRANQIAVMDKDKEYSYEILNEKSNQVANYIIQNFSEALQSPIAVLMDRSADLIVVLLGILKSGNSYIPLDPNFPKERLKHIVHHSKVSLIFGSENHRDMLNEQDAFINIIDVLNIQNDLSFDVDETDIDSAAYIIYTSGSTGNPKGVQIGHQSLVNFLISIHEQQQISSSDLLFSVTTQSFDISILEFFLPIITGGLLYIASKETLSDPFKIIEEIKVVKPTVIQATPSFYQMLFNAGWEGDKNLKILCGGDLLSRALAEELLMYSKEVWNMYGPTETTIWSSTKLLNEPNDASNIGKPIHNTQMYVIDKNKKLLPIGTEGDIYISGDGIAKGYFKDEELTNQKFTEHPFIEGGKIYNTGDIGKWNNSGEIIFLGRNDNQVKIRGYRIELDEIETAINEFEDVKSNVVIAKKTNAQEAFLVAYIIPENDIVDSVKVMDDLRHKLPSYMIPNTIIPLVSFPLTPNKKIDRKKLSSLSIEVPEKSEKFIKPTTNLEVKISRLFMDVLALEKEISITDNFFVLGGHSLNAVRLISFIEREFYYQLSLKTIFENPTVKSLSYFLQNGEVKKTKPLMPVAEKPYYPITASQYNIWLAALNKDRSIAYNMFAAFKINGHLQKGLLEEALIKIINKYEILRTNFVEINGRSYQKITSKQVSSFTIDMLTVAASEVETTIADYAFREFDLVNEMLLRFMVIQVENEVSYMVFSTHHIIMDQWSLEILMNELAKHYKALTSGKRLENEPLHFQFKDYASWLNNAKNEQARENLQFWNNYIKAYQWKNLIPFDKYTSNQNKSVAMYNFSWSEEVLNDLLAFGIKYNTTLHTLLITAFNVLIYKMYEHEDICLATVNSGRNFSDSHSQIGMFVKTLPLRSRIQGDYTFLEIVNNVYQDLLRLDNHQNIPSDVHNKLRFEILMVLQNTTFDYNTIEFDNHLQLNYHPIETVYDRLPLLIDFHKKNTELLGAVNYDTSKYNLDTLELIFMKYKKVIDQIIENPTIQIDVIDIDLPFEKEKVIEIDFSF